MSSLSALSRRLPHQPSSFSSFSSSVIYKEDHDTTTLNTQNKEKNEEQNSRQSIKGLEEPE